ncbi:MAG TPA: hypothetical protein VFE62_27965 [Gemmataceae bacterium]|nr:hypothetical protein [Gemmataceae bacterium]
MGVDIHPFIDVDWQTGGIPFVASDMIRTFNLGEFFIWRQSIEMYFALGLGQCENCPRKSQAKGRKPLFPLRGLPANAGQDVVGRYFYPVSDSYVDSGLNPSLPRVSAEAAAKWIDDGFSHRGEPFTIQRGKGKESVGRVSSPNWHCASWLTLYELRNAIDHFGVRPSALGVDAQIMIEIMAMFESRLGHGHTRLVYWFDN